MQEGGSEALNYQLITVLYAFIIEIMSQIWCWFLSHVFFDGTLFLSLNVLSFSCTLFSIITTLFFSSYFLHIWVLFSLSLSLSLSLSVCVISQFIFLWEWKKEKFVGMCMSYLGIGQLNFILTHTSNKRTNFPQSLISNNTP